MAEAAGEPLTPKERTELQRLADALELARSRPHIIPWTRPQQALVASALLFLAAQSEQWKHAAIIGEEEFRRTLAESEELRGELERAEKAMHDAVLALSDDLPDWMGALSLLADALKARSARDRQ